MAQPVGFTLRKLLPHEMSSGHEFRIFAKTSSPAVLEVPIRRDKTFVFGSMQGLRSGTGTGFAAVVATPQFIDFMQQNLPNNISRLWKSFPAQGRLQRNFVSAGQLTGVNCSGLAVPAAIGKVLMASAQSAQ